MLSSGSCWPRGQPKPSDEGQGLHGQGVEAVSHILTLAHVSDGTERIQVFVRLAGIYTTQGRLLAQTPTDCREVPLDGVYEEKNDDGCCLRQGCQRRMVWPMATGELVGIGEDYQISSVSLPMPGETFRLLIAGPGWFLREAGLTTTLGGNS